MKDLALRAEEKAKVHFRNVALGLPLYIFAVGDQVLRSHGAGIKAFAQLNKPVPGFLHEWIELNGVQGRL